MMVENINSKQMTASPDSASAAAAEAPTRRTDGGRSTIYPGAKACDFRRLAAITLRGTTSPETIEACLKRMGSSTDVETLAAQNLYEMCAPEDVRFTEDYTKDGIWNDLFGTDEVLAIARIFNRFGCLPSQIPVERLAFMTNSFKFACQYVDLSIKRNVNSLCLTNRDLVILPPRIERLVNLEFLDIGDNQLATFPVELGQLTALIRFSMSNNQFTELPTELWQFKELMELDIDGNKITSLSAELGQLTALTNLRETAAK